MKYLRLAIVALCLIAGANLVIDLAGRPATADVAEVKSDPVHDKRLVDSAAGARELRAHMRNPAAFGLDHVHLTPTGVVCYAYHSTNGYGGTVTDSAVLDNGTMYTADSPDFRLRWLRSCKGVGENVTTEVEYLAAR